MGSAALVVPNRRHFQVKLSTTETRIYVFFVTPFFSPLTERKESTLSTLISSPVRDHDVIINKHGESFSHHIFTCHV